MCQNQLLCRCNNPIYTMEMRTTARGENQRSCIDITSQCYCQYSVADRDVPQPWQINKESIFHIHNTNLPSHYPWTSHPLDCSHCHLYQLLSLLLLLWNFSASKIWWTTNPFFAVIRVRAQRVWSFDTSSLPSNHYSIDLEQYRIHLNRESHRNGFPSSLSSCWIIP